LKEFSAESSGKRLILPLKAGEFRGSETKVSKAVMV